MKAYMIRETNQMYFRLEEENNKLLCRLDHTKKEFEAQVSTCTDGYGS